MILERDRELSLVARVLDRARTGRGGLITVSGPLGIGRSTLLGAIFDRTDPAQALVLRAGGVRPEHGFPFGVVRRLADCAATGGARLPVPRRTDEFGATCFRLRDAVHDIAAGRPILVLVDDLHWVDEPSLSWLEVLTERLDRSPVVLVTTGHSGQELPLRPLSEAAVAEVVRNHFGSPGKDFVRACFTVSRGRPLFLTALLHELGDAQGVEAARPAVIGARAVQALAAEPTPVREVAYALAVLGEAAEPGLLASLTGLGEDVCEAALAALITAGLGELPAGFAHPAIRDAVENSLPAKETAERHLRTARVLHDRGRPAEVVARHLLASDDPPDGWAAGQLGAAGRAALSRGDLPTSRRYFSRALLGAEDRAELLADLAAVERSAAPVASLRHLTQALPGLSPRRRAEELAAVPLMAFELAPDALVRHLGLDARSRYARITDLTSFTDSVREFSSGKSGGDRDRLAVLLYAATLAGQDSGAVAASARRVVRAEPPSHADLRTAVPLAVRSLLAVDLFDEADSWLAAVTVQARRHWGDDAAETLIAEAERAFSLARRGWHTEAATLVARTLERADPAFTPVVSRCYETLVLVAFEGAVPDLARRALAAHRARVVPAWLGNLADGVLAESEGEALEHLLDCGRENDLMGWVNPAVLPWRSWAARLHRRLGRPDLAHDLMRQEHELAEGWGTPSCLGRSLRVWANLTDGPEGIELARRAIVVLEGSAGLPELAKAHILLGRLLRPVDRAEAADHLARGERLAKSCGIVDVCRNAGGYPAELTPAERRIARLAVAGSANQRIAAELGISVRAVEKHLTNVYRKLGVAGRAGLRDYAGVLAAPVRASPAPPPVPR